MNELQQAAEGVRNLAKQYRGVLALGEAIGKLGDLEAHRLELEKKRDAALIERDAALSSLAEVHSIADLQRARASAQADLEAAQAGTARERDALVKLRAEQTKASARVKELTAEAAAVEKKLAETRAELDALKKRLG